MPAKKFTVKETALIAEANAKAKARDPVAYAANLPKDTRPSKGGASKANGQTVVQTMLNEAKTRIIPTAPAQGATEKAPHTKRAIQQHKAEDRITAAEAKLTAAKVEVTRTTAIATKSKSNDPERGAKFLAKATAEVALLTAQKSLRALKAETMTPEQRAVTKKVTEPKVARAPKTHANRAYKPGPNKYANAKGGWTLYMVTLTLAHKTTEDATQAHKANKQGQPATKPLDFKWMDAKGYIKFT